MTLVLTCLTRDFVVQVSDQRITNMRTGELIDDSRNKATLWCSNLAFAYSGLAELGGKNTDEWLVDTILHSRTMDNAIFALREAATRHFAEYGEPSRSTRQAFVAAGWMSYKGVGEVTPIHISVSNALDDRGDWLEVALPAFRDKWTSLPAKWAFFLCPPVGAKLRHSEVRDLQRGIERAVRKGVGAPDIVRLLGETIRSVSQRNGGVGRSLIATAVPRPNLNDAPAVTIAFTAEAAAKAVASGAPTSWTIPAESDNLVITYTNSVCRGTYYTKVKSGFGPDPFGFGAS